MLPVHVPQHCCVCAQAVQRTNLNLPYKLINIVTVMSDEYYNGNVCNKDNTLPKWSTVLRAKLLSPTLLLECAGSSDAMGNGSTN